MSTARKTVLASRSRRITLAAFIAAAGALAITGTATAAVSNSSAVRFAAEATPHQNVVIGSAMADVPGGTRMSASDVAWAAAGAGAPLNNVCYTMKDLANQYVLLGTHTSRVIWKAGSGTCMGFRFINFYDLGGILYNAYQIGAGGDCLDEANNNVYNESCPADPLANEVWAQIPGPTGYVWQNEDSGYNLTADQRTGILVTAGGPATNYNQWILTQN